LLVNALEPTRQAAHLLRVGEAGTGEGLARSAATQLLADRLLGSTGMDYDGGNLTSILHTDGGGATLASFSYGYDNAGQLTLEVNTGSTTNFSYNGAGELTLAGTQSYNYDANGNQSGASTSIGADN
jgi:hypothetical protein